VDTYVRPEGELGTAHCDFKVAHKGGEPCAVCGSAIERITVQDRFAYFLPEVPASRLRSSDMKDGSGWIGTSDRRLEKVTRCLPFHAHVC